LQSPHVKTTLKLPKIVKEIAKNAKIAQEMTKSAHFLQKNTKKSQKIHLFLTHSRPKPTHLRQIKYQKSGALHKYICIYLYTLFDPQICPKSPPAGMLNCSISPPEKTKTTKPKPSKSTTKPL
jgi:hypothetical protein